MATQEKDSFVSVGRGAGSTIAAINPASNGDTWTLQTAVASNFSFSGSQGSLTGSNSINLFTLNSAAPNQWYDSVVSERFTKTNTADSVGVVARFQNINNFYHARVVSGNLIISRVLGSGTSDLATVACGFTDTSGAFYVKLCVQGFGLNGTYQNLQAKAWLASGSEPVNYMLGAIDANLTQIGLVGTRIKATSNSTTQTFTDFLATDAPPITPAPTYNVTKDVAYGITIYFNGSNPNPLPQQTIIDLKAWGNGAYIREQVPAQAIETTPGNYNWAVLDDLVYRCNQAGIRICAGLQGFPSWYMDIRGSDGAVVTAGTGELPDPTMFAAFASLAATRYNGKNGYGLVEEWQIENELYDTALTSTGTGSGRDVLGRRLAEAANLVYPAIKAASKNATIAFCAVRKTATAAITHQTNWLNNLLTYLNTSIKKFRVDTHYYRGGTFNLDPTTQSADVPSIATVLGNIATILKNKGFTNATFMVGEFGWDYYDDGTGTVQTCSWQAGYGYVKSMLDAALAFTPQCRMVLYTVNANTIIDFTANPPKANVAGSTKSASASLNGVYEYLPAYYLMQYYAVYLQSGGSGGGGGGGGGSPGPALAAYRTLSLPPTDAGVISLAASNGSLALVAPLP